METIPVQPMPAEELAIPNDLRLAEKPVSRLDYIDGLRAVACLMVLFCHMSMGLPFSIKLIGLNWSEYYISSSPLYIGYSGVDLFLCISGFCLYWPFFSGRRREPTLLEFFQRRARRILPPYYVACILAVVIGMFDGMIKGVNIFGWSLTHLLLLQNTQYRYFAPLLGQVWTIALEFQCYVLFPLYVELFRRFPKRNVLYIMIALECCYRAFMIHEVGITSETTFTLTGSVFGRSCEFLCGMFAASVVNEWNATGKCPLRWTEYLFAVLGVTYVVWANSHRVNGEIYSRYHIFSNAGWAGLYTSVLIIASRSKWPLGRLLNYKPLVALGVFSYSFYLVHGHVLMLCEHFLPGLTINGNLMALIQIIGIPALAAIIGYGYFLLFEKPFLSQRSRRIYVKDDISAPVKTLPQTAT